MNAKLLGFRAALPVIGLAALMGGECGVVSAPGAGASFFIRLPDAPASVARLACAA